jgi:Cys-tRNA(Pro) deacylase
MKKTSATRALDSAGVEYTVHTYPYVEKGGTRASSSALGVDEHIVVKTLVFQDEARKPLIVLMHGDRRVSAKDLARAIGAKKTSPCAPDVAQRHTGYQVGGTSPFGTRKPLPVYVERSILDLERIYINGGGRGFLVSIAPSALQTALNPTPVEVSRDS